MGFEWTHNLQIWSLLLYQLSCWVSPQLTESAGVSTQTELSNSNKWSKFFIHLAHRQCNFFFLLWLILNRVATAEVHSFDWVFTARCPSYHQPLEGRECPKKVLCICTAGNMTTLCDRGRGGSLTCLRWFSVQGNSSVITWPDPNRCSKLGFKTCWRLFVRCISAGIRNRDHQIDSHEFIQLSHLALQIFRAVIDH